MSSPGTGLDWNSSDPPKPSVLSFETLPLLMMLPDGCCRRCFLLPQSIAVGAAGAARPEDASCTVELADNVLARRGPVGLRVPAASAR